MRARFLRFLCRLAQSPGIVSFALVRTEVPMKSLRRNVVHGFAFTATAVATLAWASPALAEWVWVEQPEEVRVETYVQPRGPAYYQQERVIVQSAPVVTSREVFQEGPCEVTRSYWSNGTSTDDRICTQARLMLPHEFLIDRVGRHLDRLRGYERRVTVYQYDDD